MSLFLYSFSNFLSFHHASGKEELLFPMWLYDLQRYRSYAPGSVGCCTIGLLGSVFVFVVVVDAAPSSRVKAMIHAIMRVASCLALLFPPQVPKLGPKKFPSPLAVG